MFDGLTVHCIVKNEERWIWYSLMSVLEHSDKIIVYDTGSSDKTIEIIKSINSSKIELTELKSINQQEFAKLRQKQIDSTKTNWFMVLDGDEIWPEQAMKKVISRIKDAHENTLAVFVHYFEFVNDIRHYYKSYEQKSFHLHNRKELGWYAIRFVKNNSKLVCSNPYGLEGYFIDGQELQRFGKSEDYLWCDDVYYFHSRNLLRSSSLEKDKEVMLRVEKRHLSQSVQLPKFHKGFEVLYPNSFFMEHPDIVPNIAY